MYLRYLQIAVVEAGFAMYGTPFYLTLYLQRVHGASLVAGASLLPLTVLSGLPALAGGMLARKIPSGFCSAAASCSCAAARSA